MNSNIIIIKKLIVIITHDNDSEIKRGQSLYSNYIGECIEGNAIITCEKYKYK